MTIFKTLTTTLLSGISLAVSGILPAHAIIFNTRMVSDTDAAANIYDQQNKYSNVVSIRSERGICTGTLINPRTVLTAAHCFPKDLTSPAIAVSFSPDILKRSPYDQRAIGITLHPNYVLENNSVPQSVVIPSRRADLALLILDTPVISTSIRPAALAKPEDPIPTRGSLLTMVGYGYYGTGNDIKDVPTSNGRRRSAETRLGLHFKDVFLAQFRDPDSQDDKSEFFSLNREGFEAPDSQGGIAEGDSGGPLFFFIKDDSRLIQVGVSVASSVLTASHARKDASGRNPIYYSTIDTWAAVKDSDSWLSTANPLRNVSVKTGGGNWSNDSIWNENKAPNNAKGSFSASSPLGEVGRFFNVTLSQPGTVNVDMSPTIDGLIVSGSDLNIRVGQKLQVLTGSTMSSGRTVVHGTLSTPVLHLKGGTLTGTGRVETRNYGVLNTGTGIVNSGAIVAPGDANSIGTLTMADNYIQGIDGTLSIRLSGVDSDCLNVLEEATLGGTLKISEMKDIIFDQNYTVVRSQKIKGDFHRLISPPYAFHYIETGSSGDGFFVRVKRNDMPLAKIADTPSQKAVAEAVDTLDPESPVPKRIRALDQTAEAEYDIKYDVAAESTSPPSIEEVIIPSPPTATAQSTTLAAITESTPKDQLENQKSNHVLMLNTLGYDMISGGIYASTRSMFIEDSHFVRDAANDRMRMALGGVGAPTIPLMTAYGSDDSSDSDPILTSADRFTMWGGAFGTWGHRNGNNQIARLDQSTTGFLAGGDGAISDSWRVGLLAGYSQTLFHSDQRVSSGVSDNYHLGLYAGSSWGPLALRSGLAYTWHTTTMSRSVITARDPENLTAQYHAGTLQAFGELGYRLDTKIVSFEPYIHLTHVKLHTDSFTEKGGADALSGSSQSDNITFSTLGLHASSDVFIGATKLTISGTAGWRHAYGNITPLTKHHFMIDNNKASFEIPGVSVSKDAAIIEVSLNSHLSNDVTFGLSYNGQIASQAQQHGFDAKFSIKF